jgi:Rtf2 RING-finger
MGGDGGTKAVQRAYLRGAGAASTTGDGRRLLSSSSSSSNNTTITRCDPQVQQQEALRAMQYCYISDQPLQFDTDTPTITAAAPSSSSIVTCRLGRLYNKVAVIEALLERKQRLRSSASTQPGGVDDVKEGRLGGHIRGLKDIYDVRFHTVADTATSTATATATASTGQIPHCPITGRELNGMVTAYALCIPGNNLPRNNNSCNVVSEYAIQQLTEAAIMTEYGATMKIRLLPPTSALPDIHRAIALERNNKESLLLQRDKKKILKKQRDKRKRTDEEASHS